MEQQKVGCGSFGTVKLARHRTTCRMYAIKIVYTHTFRSTSKICPLSHKLNSSRGKLDSTPKWTILKSSNYGIPLLREILSIWYLNMLNKAIFFPTKIPRIHSLKFRPLNILHKLYKELSIFINRMLFTEISK